MVSPVFIGRREEIASLAALLGRVQAGAPAFTLVAGKPGGQDPPGQRTGGAGVLGYALLLLVRAPRREPGLAQPAADGAQLAEQLAAKQLAAAEA